MLRRAWKGLPEPVRRAVRTPLRNGEKAVSRTIERWRADVHVVSYPKCGRTWMRMMVGRALQMQFGVAGDPTDLYALTAGRSDARTATVHHDDDPQFKRPQDLASSKRRYRRKHVVFLVRDPLDVVVSEYFQLSRRQLERKFDGTLDDYLAQPQGSVETIVRFFNVWAAARDIPRSFTVVRYEDMHVDPGRELRRVLDAIAVPVPDGLVDLAVAESTFDRMREVEASGGLGGSKRLKVGDADDPESFKTRRGVVGGYRDYLGGEQVAVLDRYVRSELDPLYGYPVI